MNWHAIAAVWAFTILVYFGMFLTFKLVMMG